MPRPSRQRSDEQRSPGLPETSFNTGWNHCDHNARVMCVKCRNAASVVVAISKIDANDETSALSEEGGGDENMPSVDKSNALDSASVMFAQIIGSSWEIEDEDEEDECDAIGEDTKDQCDAKGVSHNPREIGCRLGRIADDFFKSKLRAANTENEMVDPSQYISDVANKILSSNTFEQFIEALPIEAAKTIGWDQVALYSYIIHTSVLMVGVGTEIKNSITSYATQFFQSRFSDWINSQPSGWDSILDEPIVD